MDDEEYSCIVSARGGASALGSSRFRTVGAGGVALGSERFGATIPCPPCRPPRRSCLCQGHPVGQASLGAAWGSLAGSCS